VPGFVSGRRQVVGTAGKFVSKTFIRTINKPLHCAIEAAEKFFSKMLAKNGGAKHNDDNNSYNAAAAAAAAAATRQYCIHRGNAF
jgi:hypothetical protein